MSAIGEASGPKEYSAIPVSKADIIERLTTGLFFNVENAWKNASKTERNTLEKRASLIVEVIAKAILAVTFTVFCLFYSIRNDRKKHGDFKAFIFFAVRFSIAYGIPHMVCHIIRGRRLFEEVNETEGSTEKKIHYAPNLFTIVPLLREFLWQDISKTVKKYDQSIEKVEKYAFRIDSFYQEYRLLAHQIGSELGGNCDFSALRSVDESVISEQARGFVSLHQEKIYSCITSENNNKNSLFEDYVQYRLGNGIEDHFQSLTTIIKDSKDESEINKKIFPIYKANEAVIDRLFLKSVEDGDLENIKCYLELIELCPEGETPIQLSMDKALLTAIRKGHKEVFDILVDFKKGELLKKSGFNQKKSPVVAAACQKSEDYLKTLETKGFNLIKEESNGLTPLMSAIGLALEGTDLTVVKRLAARMSPMESPLKNRVIKWAWQKGHGDYAKILMSKQTKEDFDEENLKTAAEHVSVEIVKTVLKDVDVSSELIIFLLGIQHLRTADNFIEFIVEKCASKAPADQNKVIKKALEEEYVDFAVKLVMKVDIQKVSEEVLCVGNTTIIQMLFNKYRVYKIAKKFPELLKKLAIKAGQNGEIKLFSIIVYAFDEEAKRLLRNLNAVKENKLQEVNCSVDIMSIFVETMTLYTYAHIYGAMNNKCEFVKKMRVGIPIILKTGHQAPPHSFSDEIQRGSQIPENLPGNILVEELVWAIDHEDEDLVKKIINATSPDIVNQLARSGLTPLMHANKLTDGHSIFNDLVNVPEVDPYVQTRDGMTVQIYAVESQNENNLRCLLGKRNIPLLNAAFIYSQALLGIGNQISMDLIRELDNKLYLSSGKPGWGLVYAAELGILPVVVKIIEEDIKKSEKEKVVNFLHIEMAMLCAHKGQHVEVFQYLDHLYGDKLMGDQEGYLLKTACRYGIKGFLDHLINKAQTFAVQEAIREAVIYDHLHIIKVFSAYILNKDPGFFSKLAGTIKRIGSKKIVVTIDFDKKIVLEEVFNTAIKYGKLEVVEYVLKNLPGLRSETGFTISEKEIKLAIEYRQLLVAKKLIELIPGAATLESTVETIITTNKAQTLKEAVPPKTVKDVQLSLGFANEYLYYLHHPDELPTNP